jgi:hypothetical protein
VRALAEQVVASSAVATSSSRLLVGFLDPVIAEGQLIACSQ